MTVWVERTTSAAERTQYTWTTATRPTTPFNGQGGFNSDFNGVEVYDATLQKWRIEGGTWTTATRPATADIAPGSQGMNQDEGMGLEYWNGTGWQLI